MNNSNFYRLNPRLQELLRTNGITSLRSIQEQSIDIIFNKENLLILAPTASGKTEAALLPIISSIFDEIVIESTLKCIYVAPLKALLNDIEERLNILKGNEDSEPYILKWHGDVSRSKKLKGLTDIPDILLITPESLEVLFISPHVNHHSFFKDVKYVIIDEIHNFASSSRGSQLISLLTRLDNISESSIQRIGLSATIGNPEEILEWMCYKSSLKSKFIKSTESTKRPEVKIIYFEDENRYLSELKHICLKGKTIIFNNSKYFTEKINQDLESIGIDSFVHHGSLSKFIREDAEEKIKNELHGVISATSTLELGIDIGDLDKVIQFQNLPSVNSFLQRMGRTGRRSGKNPFLACLTDNYYDFLIDIAIVSLGIIDKYSEPLVPSGKRYDILLQQLLSQTLSEYGANKKIFWGIINKTYCFKDISLKDFDTLIDYWVECNLIRVENEDILFGLDGEKIFGKRNFLELYSVFESNDQYEVIYNKQSIGVLDSWFVKSKTDKFLFRLAGKKWKVVEIDDGRKIIYVDITFGGHTPFWKGGSFISINYKISQRVREVLANQFDYDLINLENYERGILEYIKKENEFRIVESPEIFISEKENYIYLYTYAGTMINDILSIIIEKYSGHKIEEVDHFKIKVKNKYFSKKSLNDLLNNLKHKLSSNIIRIILFEKINVWEFSKYSKFIPEFFKKEYIISNYYKTEEFLNYFQAVRINIDNNI